jgi:hypothetical protein
MTSNRIISPASADSVRLTLDTVEKRIGLAKQELTENLGLRAGLVTEYDGTTRSGVAAIDNKSYRFRAVDTTVAVGDTGVFMRLSNSDRLHILLGVTI